MTRARTTAACLESARHAIHLAATGRNIPVAAYVDGVRQAIACPETTFKHGLETWWPVTGADVRREFRAAMARRINARCSWYGRGRKWREEWQRAARRISDLMAARILTTERDCPAEFRARLAGRLYKEGEF